MLNNLARLQAYIFLLVFPPGYRLTWQKHDTVIPSLKPTANASENRTKRTKRKGIFRTIHFQVRSQGIKIWKPATSGPFLM